MTATVMQALSKGADKSARQSFRLDHHVLYLNPLPQLLASFGANDEALANIFH